VNGGSRSEPSLQMDNPCLAVGVGIRKGLQIPAFMIGSSKVLTSQTLEFFFDARGWRPSSQQRHQIAAGPLAKTLGRKTGSGAKLDRDE